MKKISQVLSSVVLATTLALGMPLQAFAENHINLSTSDAPMANQNNINSLIANLKYKPIDILIQEGEKIANPPVTESMMRDGRFTVIERKVRDAENHSADIAVMDSNAANILSWHPPFGRPEPTE